MKKQEGWGVWRDGWLLGGDYTIIQITAGNNLVADVSRSTMPTAHKCVCVCVFVHTHTKSFGACRNNSTRHNLRYSKTRHRSFLRPV